MNDLLYAREARVVMFCANEAEDVTVKVNAWLKKQPQSVTIERMTQSSTPHGHCITLLYKEND
ncbi:hypothetical protein A3C87_02040 [Candidatus Kaiserbacteria bacterium RIFCSPHIGHO2_02_FULL_49_34]|uniref:Uncharacterized protein n=1 Tax=Candidatus Kaiserbacteria bacterium RIFCSPHIGHO2_02_FULL_49_34 TaxID=1798491 RepID=A0A1F6DHX5_9BACT|nr:MAG: hypothetical protein A3C87_02040 [Candidatus Kaiserbacteria bacterium RIFCSPHIGHO2_02_FULL_49_34]